MLKRVIGCNLLAFAALAATAVPGKFRALMAGQGPAVRIPFAIGIGSGFLLLLVPAYLLLKRRGGSVPEHEPAPGLDDSAGA